ncbi:MAG: DUF2782 domain-containing protein [Gammaproteobacteria bacterium]|nr:DUF2782 domain-containing protein [Gammaproteobacteria bacterium]MCW8988725.1 DUF2782 domain-containing protein [Gammaproteobacteria bacterium]MCW9031449.1 DUF2782 domain-containing protein [Gammaproteobacteria bacterium]
MTFLKVIASFTLFVFSFMTLAVEDTPPSLNKEEKNFTTNNNGVIPTIPDEEDDSRNIPQPEVRIIHKKDTVIEEYRVDGRLRFIKITPTSGKPYYMVDMDGDGVLETRDDNFANPPINQWILLEW